MEGVCKGLFGYSACTVCDCTRR